MLSNNLPFVSVLLTHESKISVRYLYHWFLITEHRSHRQHYLRMIEDVLLISPVLFLFFSLSNGSFSSSHRHLNSLSSLERLSLSQAPGFPFLSQGTYNSCLHKSLLAYLTYFPTHDDLLSAPTTSLKLNATLEKVSNMADRFVRCLPPQSPPPGVHALTGASSFKCDILLPNTTKVIIRCHFHN